MTKYAMAVLVTACMIRLVVWANDGCPAFLGGILAAVSTMLLSFCGGLLEWKDQPDQSAVFLEGVIDYMRSADFNPSAEITVDELKKKLAEKPRQVSLKRVKKSCLNY